jgi:MoxR-like ATPase
VLQGASTRSLVMALPALQSLAMMSGRDHVAPTDLERLLIPVFSHRLEFVSGISQDEGAEVIRECARPVFERLAQMSMRRA